MKIETKFNLGDRVMTRIFPGKFEWCTIHTVLVSVDQSFSPAYQMDNGLIIKEKHVFSTREEAIQWAEKTPYHES